MAPTKEGKTMTKHYTADEFVEKAVRDGDNFTLKADGSDVVVTVPRDAPWRIYRLSGRARGSIIVKGSGEGYAHRDGSGYGHTVRDGSGAGRAYREGKGDGDAWRIGKGTGGAMRVGSGEGGAYRFGSGDGYTWRSGSGSGDTKREGSGKRTATPAPQDQHEPPAKDLPTNYVDEQSILDRITAQRYDDALIDLHSAAMKACRLSKAQDDPAVERLSEILSKVSDILNPPITSGQGDWSSVISEMSGPY